MAEMLTPGSRGRFYLFTAFDIWGVHGVRLPDGRSVFGFPGNNKKLFLILRIVDFIFRGNGEREAKAQCEDDGGYATRPLVPRA